MTYERFLKITTTLKMQDEVVHDLYERKVNLIEFVDPYHQVITELIKEVYGDEGYDWWSWFCYESEYGTKGMQAWDENKNSICYDYKSTWEYLEKHYSKLK